MEIVHPTINPYKNLKQPRIDICGVSCFKHKGNYHRVDTGELFADKEGKKVMKIRVIDFETTGFPDEGASICEAAFVDLIVSAGEFATIGDTWESLVQPTDEMDIKALAVHHITEKEAKEKGITREQADKCLTKDQPTAYAAHNAEFERAFFNPVGAQWIDTYKVALRLWPDAPGHSNQVLRYWLGLEDKSEFMPPHRALPDAFVTAHILNRQLKYVDFETMLKWSAEPKFLTTINFGKHRGKKFSEVPTDYLQWIVRQDMDDSIILAAKRALQA